MRPSLPLDCLPHLTVRSCSKHVRHPIVQEHVSALSKSVIFWVQDTSLFFLYFFLFFVIGIVCFDLETDAALFMFLAALFLILLLLFAKGLLEEVLGLMQSFLSSNSAINAFLLKLLVSKCTNHGHASLSHGWGHHSACQCAHTETSG